MSGHIVGQRNAGYDIVAAIPAVDSSGLPKNNEYVVAGFDTTREPTMGYVTWRVYKNQDNTWVYYLGHYMMDYGGAMRDMSGRANL